MAILEIGLHDIEDRRVVTLQIFGYFSDGSAVDFMLINDTDTLIVRYEFLRQPLLLRCSLNSQPLVSTDLSLHGLHFLLQYVGNIGKGDDGEVVVEEIVLLGRRRW